MTAKQVFGTSHVPLSPAVRAGDLIYVSGQVPVRADGTLEDGGIEAQTRQVLENLRICLEAAGSSLDEVVKVTAFLADLGDFAAYNDVYREYFHEPYPARTTVGAMLPQGILVEIEALARRRTS